MTTATTTRADGTSASISLPDPGPPLIDFERPADRARLERVAAALTAKGFQAQVADSAADARELALAGIPEGAEVHIALSETMRELGITGEVRPARRCARGLPEAPGDAVTDNLTNTVPTLAPCRSPTLNGSRSPVG